MKITVTEQDLNEALSKNWSPGTCLLAVAIKRVLNCSIKCSYGEVIANDGSNATLGSFDKTATGLIWQFDKCTDYGRGVERADPEKLQKLKDRLPVEFEYTPNSI